MKYCFFILLLVFLFSILGCKEKIKFRSNFDNDAFLSTKVFLDTNSNRRDSANIKIIGTLYDKKQKPYINDTVLFKTYWEYTDGNTDAFCGASNYHLKRRIGPFYVYQDGTFDTIFIGILSANIEKSLAKFIHYVDSCLKGTYFKTIESSTPFDVNLNIKLNSCRIGSVLITTEKEVDNNFINELYRIIYTSPKWQLEEVPATPTEKKDGSYNRDKLLNLNIIANNSKTEIINYTVDSF